MCEQDEDRWARTEEHEAAWWPTDENSNVISNPKTIYGTVQVGDPQTSSQSLPPRVPATVASSSLIFSEIGFVFEG